MPSGGTQSASQSALVPVAALELLEPDEASDEPPLDESELEEESEPAPVDELSEPAMLRFLPDLKSVSYQPLPFRRKRGTESNFLSASA